MTDRPDVEGTTDPDPGESPFARAPFVAQGEAMSGSPGVLEGPFRWVVLAQGFSSLAFWATFGTMFAEATNRFHATSSEMAVLGAALSIPFILGSLLQASSSIDGARSGRP